MRKGLENGIQTFLQEAGESGCYALCLIDVACEYLQTELNVIEALKLGVDKGCIYYNDVNPNDNDNFYVSNPATWLYYMTSKHWEVTKGPAFYKAKKNEFIINRWERRKTGSVIAHFDRETFHPLMDSQTVKYGEIASTRVCLVKE